MPITTSCPGCTALFRLPDELAGKSVRCQKCARMFLVSPHGGVAEETPVSELPAAPPVPELPGPAPTAALVEEPVVIAPQPASVVAPPNRTLLATSIACFVLALLLIVGFASIWIATHLASPVNSMIVPRFRGANHDPNKHIQINPVVPPEKLWRPPHEPILLDLGPGEELSWPSQLVFANPEVDAQPFDQFGPFCVYRVRLLAGKTYHFHVHARNFTARVKLHFDDVNQTLAGDSADFGERRLLFSHKARVTGEHQIWIYSQEMIPGDFTLTMAAEARFKQQPLKVGDEREGQLRITDALDRMHRRAGTFREYGVQLEAGQAYRIQVESKDFTPWIKINANGGPVEEARGDITYRPLFTGEHRVRVTSRDCALGNYTLKITKK